jgi:hypothetical protein
MATLTLDVLLKPFEYLDISSLYTHYAFIIDAVISFFIFFGVTKVTIGRRFEGRGGNAITIGVGLALSIGFLVMEKTLNFSLQSFGPLAAAIILLLVGFVLYGLLHALGFSHMNAICLAYIINYLSLRLVSPTIFDWIAETAPFINGILAIGFIIALVKLIISLFSRNSINSLSSKLSTVPASLNLKPYSENYAKEISEDKEEVNLIDSKLIQVTKKEIKDSDEMINSIKEMIRALEEYGSSPPAIREISNALNKIKEKEHYSLVYLTYINKILDSVGRFDNDFYATLKAEYEAIQGGKQKEFKKREIESEEKKREIEDALKKYENLISQHTRGFNNALANTIWSLRNNNSQEAIKYLQLCLNVEEKIKEIFVRMKDMEGALKKMTKRNLKFLKKEKRKFS